GVVEAEWIVGAHEPPRAELVGMNVHEDPLAGTPLEGDLADQPPEPAGRALLDGGAKERLRIAKMRPRAARERFHRPDRRRAQIHDRLEEDGHLLRSQ